MLLWFLCIAFSGPHKARAADDLTRAGDGLLVFLPAIALGATVSQNDNEGLWQFSQSIVTTAAVTYGLKGSIDKKRPNGEDHSFPSGHTSVSFQSAAFIHLRYGPNYAIPAYLGACIVGYSRIEGDYHYLEDVVAGALIGVLSSWYFTRPYPAITFVPLISPSSHGLWVSIRF